MLCSSKSIIRYSLPNWLLVHYRINGPHPHRRMVHHRLQSQIREGWLHLPRPLIHRRHYLPHRLQIYMEDANRYDKLHRKHYRRSTPHNRFLLRLLPNKLNSINLYISLANRLFTSRLEHQWLTSMNRTIRSKSRNDQFDFRASIINRIKPLSRNKKNSCIPS